MARTRAQQEEGTEPELDLARSDLPKRQGPDAVLTRIVELYERFVTHHPERAEALLRRCQDLTERFRPSRTSRELNARQAADRIGVSRPRVIELFRVGRLGERVE